MIPYYDHNGITIYCGDCLDVMAELEENSIDSIVTDPPYGISFMSANWDHGVPGIPFWQAALRAAKPGAMLLSFGGTRTYHRLTCAIEDAGWIVRDCLMYIYGSGFPKSLDISKKLDQMAGAEREVVGRVPRSYPDSERWGNPLEARAGGAKNPTSYSGSSHDDLPGKIVTAPATDAAREWDGWGTNLKPAYEAILLAMAPMPSTFAENALEWGVAGLNIDGCRVETDDNLNGGAYSLDTNNHKRKPWEGGEFVRRPGEYRQPQGRWPANVIHDGSPEVLAGFPSPHGAGHSNYLRKREGYDASSYEIKGGDLFRYGDTGSAARFFYCAKASRAERGEGNNHPTVKPLELVKYLCRLTRMPTGGIVLDPFMGSGTTLLAAQAEGRQAIGIDISEEYCQIAVERLERMADSQPPLPLELPEPVVVG